MCNSIYDISNDITSNFLGFGESCSSNSTIYSNNYYDNNRNNKQKDMYDYCYNSNYSIKDITNKKIRHIYHNFFDVIIYNETYLNSSFLDNSEMTI